MKCNTSTLMAFAKPFSVLIIFAASITAKAQRQPGTTISPEVLPDNSVMFRLKAPGAMNAEVRGTWPSHCGNVQSTGWYWLNGIWKIRREPG